VNFFFLPFWGCEDTADSQSLQMSRLLEPSLSSPNFVAAQPRLAVVVPCYRVTRHIAGVLRAIGPEVWRIYCVDDACPEQSGQLAMAAAMGDARIRVLTHQENLGVGGAVVTGYKQALQDGADIIVKLDGDGQMDPRNILSLIAPIIRGEADYAKGNRFFHLDGVRSMPFMRIIGNAGLSFMSKLSTGYWNLFDPTNGYTAIHAAVLRLLPLEKLSRRYFFESDILFRLSTLRAVVKDVPMNAHYADEKSNMSLPRVLGEFPVYHTRNFVKRIFYNYFLRNFSVASLHLVFGMLLVGFGITFGLWEWFKGAQMNVIASPGTVMLAALPVLLGTQLLLSFIGLDVASVPDSPIQRKMRDD